MGDMVYLYETTGNNRLEAGFFLTHVSLGGLDEGVTRLFWEGTR